MRENRIGYATVRCYLMHVFGNLHSYRRLVQIVDGDDRDARDGEL